MLDVKHDMLLVSIILHEALVQTLGQPQFPGVRTDDQGWHGWRLRTIPLD